MPPLPNRLADEIRDTISTAIRRVREIFAEERPADAVNDSIPKCRKNFYFNIIWNEGRRYVCFGMHSGLNVEVARGPKSAISRCEQIAAPRAPLPRWPLAALDQGQEPEARIADARVLTRRVGLHPMRLLLPVRQLLQKLLKLLGRRVLTTTRRSSAGGFDELIH
jgi:hypothetical protein